jgi:2-polyprenyl-6-methoxyphenol hydroxylase-like FAD-dependent oxidoreductase
MTRRALIVGAGIGGLSAALALRHAGWDVRVFEQSPTPRELGFGVALAPNAIAALRQLNLADTVINRGFQPRRGEFRRPDGTVLKRAEMPPGMLGGPMLIALRPALHGALVDAVGLDTMTLGKSVTSFSDIGNRVSVHLADGTTAEGDLLVGADGVGSVVRRILHSTEGPPRHCGIVAVRGAVHDAHHHLGDRDAIFYLGPGVESMFVRASNTGIYWFLSLAMQLVPPQLREPSAIVAAMAPAFDHTFRAITSATQEMRVDELVDRDPLPFWGTGNVTLLGDAAHPVLPHTGQGAAQAIVDAVALGKTLAGGHETQKALREYERERMPKTAALLAQGRRTARVMASTNSVLCTVRELALRAIPITTFARLYVRINRRAGTDISYQ